MCRAPASEAERFYLHSTAVSLSSIKPLQTHKHNTGLKRKHIRKINSEGETNKMAGHQPPLVVGDGYLQL